MGCKGSKNAVQAVSPLNRVKEIVPSGVLEPSTLQQSQGIEGQKEIITELEKDKAREMEEAAKEMEEKESTVRVRSFHLLVEDAPNITDLAETKRATTSSKPATNRSALGKSGSQVMLNVLYDEPITNPELELQRTLAEGRFKLDEIHKMEEVSQSPLIEPKEAFISGNSL